MCIEDGDEARNFEAEAIKCHATAARDRVSRKFAGEGEDPTRMDGLLIVVKEVDD